MVLQRAFYRICRFREQSVDKLREEEPGAVGEFVQHPGWDVGRCLFRQSAHSSAGTNSPSPKCEPNPKARGPGTGSRKIRRKP